MKFTKASVAALTLPAGKDEYIAWDEDLPGFGIRLRGDTRRWVCQYRIGGHRQRRETLGDPRKVRLEDARKIAQQRFAAVELGRDPAAERAKTLAQARLTLDYAADRYLAVKQSAVRPNTYEQIRLHLTVHWKPLRNQPLHEITRADVAARLQDLTREYGRTSAARARANLSALFNWAMREGLCEANPVFQTNDPERGVPSRERVLTDHEIQIVWNACGDDDYGRIVRLLLLTGCRREEIGDLKRAEVADGTLRIPGERIKNKRELVLGLPPVALGILNSVSGRGDLYFGRGREGSYNCWGYDKARLDARIMGDTGKALAPWRLHDLRRTVRTGMGRIGVPPHIAELVINHVKGGIEAVYDRHRYEGEIAQALLRWSEHVLDLVEGRAQRVVPLLRG